MKKIWKTIKVSSFKNIHQLIKELKRNNVIVSPWIKNIVKNKKNNILISKKKFILYKIRVSELNFKTPTTLKNIYKKIKLKKYSLVPPDIALQARLVYKNQKKGEWLRFATPMKSMIDSDNVPHLPKLGKALGKYFVETYWSYPKAIFHPRNEFIVAKNDF